MLDRRGTPGPVELQEGGAAQRCSPVQIGGRDRAPHGGLHIAFGLVPIRRARENRTFAIGIAADELGGENVPEEGMKLEPPMPAGKHGDETVRLGERSQHGRRVRPTQRRVAEAGADAAEGGNLEQEVALTFRQLVEQLRVEVVAEQPVRPEKRFVEAASRPARNERGEIETGGPAVAESDVLVLSLDLEGIACSSGSACMSGAIEPSHVVRALGHEHELRPFGHMLEQGFHHVDAHRVRKQMDVVENDDRGLTEELERVHELRQCAGNRGLRAADQAGEAADIGTDPAQHRPEIRQEDDWVALTFVDRVPAQLPPSALEPPGERGGLPVSGGGLDDQHGGAPRGTQSIEEHGAADEIAAPAWNPELGLEKRETGSGVAPGRPPDLGHLRLLERRLRPSRDPTRARLRRRGTRRPTFGTRRWPGS